METAVYDLEDLSLATRLFHSPDVSELLEALCDDDGPGSTASDQARPAVADGNEAGINDGSVDTFRAGNGAE